ncbi:RNA polymerase sigma factor [Aneurinibacillus aneurinilyticus]|jgi:RNA polymerase sigma-70 factor (ECF subfamily)|nr:sigma-70 family RNA polymerase sigma factor [Aneurinibacillus aneurinilyticus]MCI1693887.1 sigma-70 family RNA polymerase sigma factor [Aneurinibacillus aneurinilyticus]MED0709434.1 sigma-70 family RNA polymerase sigma factor [Aneurinibacillus aneurinilyticus]MED0724631.1 sigma-70 family RNA polymerase sigma factor [Aneurinibacillus aneurinilyticus]MED0732068.1 sigma-70 family RNA polymerase sigma factor [Aneurinibacillus aneurinilyticus]MED0740285.1 sigma-70 family RNA polymerase sigma fac
MEEEREWVARVLHGDKEAYAHLVNKYKNKVYALLLGMGVAPQDAQDITQESFIKAYRHLATYNQDKKFSSWLYKIAANSCLDAWRKQRREILDEREEEYIETASPEHAYLHKEQAQELRKHIDHLPEKYRLVLVLRYIDDLSYKEIAEVLDLPLPTVQTHLHRAKKKLRDALCDTDAGGNLHEMYGV